MRALRQASERAVESSAPLASTAYAPSPDARPRGVFATRRPRPVLRLLTGGAASPPSTRADRLVTVTEPSARDTSEVDELVRRSQRGDRVAFTELFRRHRGDVSRLVFRMLGPTADAEDVVQEVFLQVHKSLGEFRGQAKFTTWLHRVTVNVVLMVRRAARSRPVFAGEPVADHEPDRGLLPDEDAARRARIAAFRRLLDRLPEKKRTVFVLHEIEGIAPAEIAEMVDAPVLT